MKKKLLLTALIVAVLAVMIGSASIVSAIAKNEPSKTAASAGGSADAADSSDEERLNTQIYSATHNRCRWLYDLLSVSGKAQLQSSANPQEVFETARDLGVIGAYSEEDMVLPLNRLFVAQTTVKALGYKQRDAGRITDISAKQSEMSTMAYYGYFLPDVNLMVHPDAQITAKEYDALLEELGRYRLLKGKKVLSFGDSIMYGSGNSGEGICDMISEKYGMTALDYAVPGSTMGYRNKRGHIRDQLKKAADEKVQPDIILINGGTNDMNHVELGTYTQGFDMSKTEEATFTGGFEKTLWSLKQTWRDVPIVYIRVHNMDLGSGEKELLFGERAVDITKKWSIPTVDLYKDTDMNTEDPYVAVRYTYCPGSDGVPDTIHPTAVGYAKYYLPLISEAVVNQFNEE